MRRLVLVVPELGGISLEQDLPHLRVLSEMGELRRMVVPETPTPEALMLGARPGEINLAEGPLTIAAIGARPPEWSLQFAVSTLSWESGTVSEPVQVTREDQNLVSRLGSRLNTKTLTFVAGTSTWRHGLVLEKEGELHTTSPKELIEGGFEGKWPQGDFEPILRRFIDDSVNLLMEQEFNLRRVDEGLPPVNLFWPWGHGVLGQVPNLALRLGIPVEVATSSPRLLGLTRLVGHRVADLAVGEGLQTRFQDVATWADGDRTGCVLLNGFASLSVDQEEEQAWWVRELDQRLLKPLYMSPDWRQTRLAILCPRPGGEGGFALLVNGDRPTRNQLPFREDILAERRLPKIDLDEAVRATFRYDGGTQLPWPDVR